MPCILLPAQAGTPVWLRSFFDRGSCLARKSCWLKALQLRMFGAGASTPDTAALQVHVRHLVGGRARGEQVLSDERLFTVAGPERLGAVSLPHEHILRVSFMPDDYLASPLKGQSYRHPGA